MKRSKSVLVQGEGAAPERALVTSACLVGGGAVGIVATAASRADAAPSCGTACYVAASTGNDANAGTAGSPLQTIQAGINAVSVGGTVYVRPGNYSETAANVSPTSIAGTYQFGLYLGKSNITVQGVHVNDTPITNYADPAMPDVKTNATETSGRTACSSKATTTRWRVSTSTRTCPRTVAISRSTSSETRSPSRTASSTTPVAATYTSTTPGTTSRRTLRT